MAATIVKKDAGGGWFECVVGTNDATGVDATASQKTTIAIIRLNKAAYDGMDTAGKNDVKAVTLDNLITATFN